MKNLQKICLIHLILMALSGCKVGPKHFIPHVPTEEAWHAARGQNEYLDSREHGQVLKMWELFDDPLLANYLESLIELNLDVKAAYAKVRQAYAARKIAKAGLFPFLNNRVDYHSSKPAGGILTSPQDVPVGNQPLGGIPLNLKEQTFLADFDAVWEIDFFGKRRNEIDSATALFEMQIENKRAVYVALLAEFGRNYLELRRNQASRAIFAREIEVLSERVELGKKRLREGLDSEMALLGVESLLRNAKGKLFEADAIIASLIYHLSRLLGKPPGALYNELSPASPIPVMVDKIPVGIPSEILRRRPDIRAAEKELAEKTADVGVAVADLYPRVIIDGSYGFQDLHLGLMKGKGESWSFGGNVLTPVFHWGELRGEVEKKHWIRMGAMIEYQNTVLMAFEEVESSMARLLMSKESLQEKDEGYKKQRELLRHTKDLVLHGLANQIDLDEAELNTLKEEQDFVQQMGETAIQLIALYKALGGGWK